MGGINEMSIDGLRFHENAGDIHIHDDTGKYKYVQDKASFKNDIKDAINSLKRNDGVVCLIGDNKMRFYLIKDSGKYHFFITDNRSKKSNLNIFLEGC